MKPGLHLDGHASSSKLTNGHEHIKASKENGTNPRTEAGQASLYDDFLKKLQGNHSVRWPADKEAACRLHPCLGKGGIFLMLSILYALK